MRWWILAIWVPVKFQISVHHYHLVGNATVGTNKAVSNSSRYQSRLDQWIVQLITRDLGTDLLVQSPDSGHPPAQNWSFRQVSKSFDSNRSSFFPGVQPPAPADRLLLAYAGRWGIESHLWFPPPLADGLIQAMVEMTWSKTKRLQGGERGGTWGFSTNSNTRPCSSILATPKALD